MTDKRPAGGGARLDPGAKLLLERYPGHVLRAARPDAVITKPLEKEVLTAQLTPDGVFLGREGKRRVVHQVEFLAEPSSRVGREVARRACTLWVTLRKPVRVSLFYLHPAKDGRAPPREYALPLDEASVPVRFRVVAVWRDLDARGTLARPCLGLLPLVGLMKGHSLNAIRRAAALIRKLAPSAAVKADLMAALYLLSGHHYPPGSLRDMIPKEVLMQSSTYLEAVELGKREGKREGKLEGKLEGERTGLLLIARARLSAKLLAEVEAIEDLDELRARLLELLRA